MTRNAGGEVESSFIWRIKDDHQTGWAPSRVAKSRFVLKYFRTSAAFKRARRGLRRRGRRVEPAAASRWTPSSRYAARVRDLPRRDTVRVPADHRARGEESIFSVPPRVPTKASLDGANPPPILRPSSTSVRTRRALNHKHASSDPPRVSPPHTITPQDASERPSVLEHILAWLQAGIPNEEREDLKKKKSAEPISEPPSAVTAAGFATRGAFAAAVLHTARAACAGVLRASSAKALATNGQTRANENARSDGAGAAFSARGPSGLTPRGASSPPSGSSPGGGIGADIADESQFPSLGGARRRLDDAGGANGYGGEPRSNALFCGAAEDAFPALPSRPSARPPRTKAPKRIQPTSTRVPLAPGAREGLGKELTEEDSERASRSRNAADVETSTTSTAYEKIGTPGRAAAAARGEPPGEPPVTPGSAVAAPPLRRVDFSASPGAEKNSSTGVFFGAGAGALVGSSLFPASSADAEAEAAAEAEVATRLREATMSDGLSAETRRSSFELSPPLVALATFHAAAIRHGIVPDLAPEVAFLCDALAAPIDVVAGSDETRSETHSVVVASGAAARRYAAFALSRSGRAPHAAGERALGALCASAALRRHAPACTPRSRASSARRAGASSSRARRIRRRIRAAPTGEAPGRRSAFGAPRALRSSARRISSPRRSRARGRWTRRRRGARPPAGRGGRRRVRRRGEHREGVPEPGKCRDALYAAARARRGRRRRGVDAQGPSRG